MMAAQQLITQLQHYLGIGDWAEERYMLERYRQEGDAALQSKDYGEAFYAYQQMKNRLLAYLFGIRKVSRYARFSGWAVALFTGGFGLEDVFLVPLVNKMVLHVLGVDSNTYIEKLKYALRQSCRTLAFVKLPVWVDRWDDEEETYWWWEYKHEDALRDFLLLYELSARPSDPMKRLLDLVDPLGLTGDEDAATRVSDAALMDRLLQAMEREGKAIHEIHASFFAYLHRQGMTDSIFYQRLRMKGYTH